MPAPTNITLILKGLLCIFVNPAKTLCTVGVLRDTPPGHDLNIVFSKQPPGGVMTKFKELKRPGIASRLRLVVEHTSKTNITFRKPDADINRQLDPTANDQDSFRWVVDFEGPELYNGKIGARKGAFDPILTFNNAELFTKAASKTRLFIQQGLTQERFGFVALEIGVDISLDQENSKARFLNGTTPVFESEADTNYEVVIDNDADPTLSHPDIVTDANHYYKAVGWMVPEMSKIYFMSISTKVTGPAGPEAACFSSFLSQSQL